MSFDDIRNDPMLQLLKTLEATDVDGARADRIRVRCRNALGRRQRLRWVTGVPVSVVSQRVVEFAVVATLCGVYLAEVLRRALSLLG